MAELKLQIVHAVNGKQILTVSNLSSISKISDVKLEIYHIKKNLYPSRQSLRLEQKGKTLPDEATLASLSLKDGSKLYFKDLGPQIGWSTVFFCEYAGPLILYLFMYSRPKFVYGALANKAMHDSVQIAAGCWSLHYAKRILETFFVHRFSHGTMPIRNLFKNCSYYWLFGLVIGYFVNHPLYTPPLYGNRQLYIGLGLFAFGELGNFSIHLLFSNLRPKGSTVRKIPVPNSNPLTLLTHFVSCPNYTYEFVSWVGFTLMSQCLPAGVFAFAGLYQMSIWALGKHRNYRREFSNYPKSRKAIIPFLL